MKCHFQSLPLCQQVGKVSEKETSVDMSDLAKHFVEAVVQRNPLCQCHQQKCRFFRFRGR